MTRRDHLLCIVPESFLFAGLLIVILQIQYSFLRVVGLAAMFPWLPQGTSMPIQYLWAGIWEEAAFRLCLYGGMVWGLSRCKLNRAQAQCVSLLVSSALFSICHHVGRQGDPWEFYRLLFRFEAGILFCTLFAVRGYPTAALTHGIYDVLVGCVLPLIGPTT